MWEILLQNHSWHTLVSSILSRERSKSSPWLSVILEKALVRKCYYIPETSGGRGGSQTSAFCGLETWSVSGKQYFLECCPGVGDSVREDPAFELFCALGAPAVCSVASYSLSNWFSLGVSQNSFALAKQKCTLSSSFLSSKIQKRMSQFSKMPLKVLSKCIVSLSYLS